MDGDGARRARGGAVDRGTRLCSRPRARWARRRRVSSCATCCRASVATVAVATTLAVGRGILLESALSFFGVGVQPPAASWGNMLYQAQTTMSTEPWLSVFPGAFIFLTVMCCQVLGDALGADQPA